ncbi:MAG: hypothetical protein PHE59_05405 [Patescibacteria group bacterium]|nr:hypothetical protein [Patescibacteria group bacterium]
MAPVVVMQIALEMRPRSDITHEELDRLFLKIAHGFGWKAAHFRPAKTAKGWRTPVAGDGKGFLDWLLVKDRVLAIELKTQDDQLRPEQKEWVGTWEGAGVEVHVFWPKDWDELVQALAP